MPRPSDEEVAAGPYAPLATARTSSDDASPLQRLRRHAAVAALAALAVGVGVGVGVIVGRAPAAPRFWSASPPSANPPNIPPECVTALGGGVMGPGGSVHMDAGRGSAGGGASCRSALAAYAAQPGGAYWRDVEAAVGAAYAALGISADDGADGGAGAGAGADAGPQPPPRGVVVFDIDETALSNAPLSSSPPPSSAAAPPPPFPTALFSSDGARRPSPPSWRGRDASSPALEPTLRLYKALQRQGLAAAFVTGRGEASREETERNLRAAGYGGRCSDEGGRQGEGDGRREGAGGAPRPCYLSLTLRQPGDARPASVYKPEARRAVARATGLAVVGSVGDQWSDLSGQEVEAGAGGEAAAASYVAIKLPNPFYYIL